VDACDCAGNILDCNGVCGGFAWVDECGECGGPGLNKDGCCGQEEKDCNDECGGDAVEDCFGVCGGDAVVDEYGECVGYEDKYPHCTAILIQAYSHVCSSTEETCSVISYDGTPCPDICAEAGLECQEVRRNLGGTCEEDIYSATLSCGASHGDPTELCVCGPKTLKTQASECISSCKNKTCGDDGCGGSCGSCAGSKTCAQGNCLLKSMKLSTELKNKLPGNSKNATYEDGQSVDSSTSSSDYYYEAYVVDEPLSQMPGTDPCSPNE
jgi:hypothetical protein